MALLSPDHAPWLAEIPRPPSGTTTYAQAIMARHECWTLHEKALAAWPGHVVATTPTDHTRPVYAGPWLVHLAMEQVAHDVPSLGWDGGVDHGLVVYGFCR